MAKFKYIGDPRIGHEDDGPGRTIMFDLEFKRGEEVEVKSAKVAAKLRRNSHFAEVGGSPELGQPQSDIDSGTGAAVGDLIDDGPGQRTLRRRAEMRGA